MEECPARWGSDDGIVKRMAQAAKAAKAAKPAKAKAVTKATGKPNVFARLSRYLSDVRAEMRRVVWPSRSEVINSSGIVMVTLVIFIIMISLYDQISVFLVGILGNIGG